MSEAAKPQAEAPAPPTSGKSLSKIEIIAFLVVVIAAQIVLAFLFIPRGGSSTAAAATAEKEKPKDHDKKAAAGHDAADSDTEHEEIDEVNLGKFSLTAFNPSSSTTLLIDFQLFGTVLAEPTEGMEAGGHGGHGAAKGPPSDEPDAGTKFGRLYKKNKHRIRDQVIKIIRTAEMSDLTDPGLGLIKRQILTKTNALLGEPLLKEVIFSDFAVIEQ